MSQTLFTYVLHSFHFDTHGNLWNDGWSSQIVDTSNIQSKHVLTILADDLPDNGWTGKQARETWDIVFTLCRLKEILTNLNLDFLNFITRVNFIRHFLKCVAFALQGSIYDWVRLHRLHHQTFKTSDDPFYSDKDFLHSQVFSHIRKLSPRQEKLLDTVNMKDIEEDGIVMFQKRFYWILYLIIFVLLPINAPLEYWNDSVQAAIFVAFSLRYIVVINIAWLINSAHFIWGLDKNHKQSDSNMVFIVTKR